MKSDVPPPPLQVRNPTSGLGFRPQTAAKDHACEPGNTLKPAWANHSELDDVTDPLLLIHAGAG